MLVPSDKAALESLIDSTLSPDFVSQVAGTPTENLIDAEAAVGARVSQATKNVYDGLSACDAGFGTLATGDVDCVRTGTVAGTIPAGTILIDLDGNRFSVFADIVFADHQLTANNKPVLSQSQSFQANLLAGTPLFSMTPMFDSTSTFAVSSLGLLHGHSADLELLGRDKGLEPTRYENEEHFRQRLRTLPVGCDPISIARLVSAYDIGSAGIGGWSRPGTGIIEGCDMAGPAAADENVPGSGDFFSDQALDEGTPLPWSTSFQNYFVTRIHAEPDPTPSPALKSMCNAIEIARAGGVRWHIEEVTP